MVDKNEKMKTVVQGNLTKGSINAAQPDQQQWQQILLHVAAVVPDIWNECIGSEMQQTQHAVTPADVGLCHQARNGSRTRHHL